MGKLSDEERAKRAAERKVWWEAKKAEKAEREKTAAARAIGARALKTAREIIAEASAPEKAGLAPEKPAGEPKKEVEPSAAALETPATPKREPRAARSSEVEIYGIRVPRETPRVAVELGCYRDHRRKEWGGLGDEEHFRRAWQLVWPKFQWNEFAELVVWAFVNHRWVMCIGPERSGKTYVFAHCALLDYLAEPMPWDKKGDGVLGGGTLTTLGTVTFDGLKLRMWSDLLRAAETATGYPMADTMQIRSSTNELRMYPRSSARESAEKFQIHGQALNQSQSAEGRIRGGHAPRRRIFLDEAENIAPPIYSAIINPMSAPEAKAVLITNPVEKISKFGEFCEPEGGWASVSDGDLFWTPKKFKDGIVLHLDGLKSPNVRANSVVCPGLITNENIAEIKRMHGEDSVQWWALARGFFCPDGLVARVFPAAVIEKAKPPIVFDWRTEPCASLDPAFEFDACVLHEAELGRPVYGVNNYRINCLASETLKTTVSAGSEPKDYQIARQVIDRCRARGVKPRHFIMDGTGGGRGVVAILQKEWSRDIQVIQYGGAATERALRGDNPMKCCDIYRYFVSELWCRSAECCKDGLIGGLANLDPRTIEDLFARRYELVQGTQTKLIMVEAKAEMKKRIGRSPDWGDALVQFGELLVRLGTFVGKPAPGSPQSPSGRWEKHRQLAIARTKRHTEAKEYAY